MIEQWMSNCPIIGQCLFNFLMVGQRLSNCPVVGQGMSCFPDGLTVYVQLSNDWTVDIQLSDDWTVHIQLYSTVYNDHNLF